jgi:hypothetical protein
MVPDIDLQLRVVIRALRDVVLPAVDSGNRPALEQLHLSIATLVMAEARLPLAGGRLRAELANAIALAEAADAAALAAPLSTAKAVLEDPRADTRDLEIHKARLLTAVSTLVDDAPGDGARADSLARAVVATSKPQFDLIRAWCLPAGFEPDPDEVPPIERLLAKPGPST